MTFSPRTMISPSSAIRISVFMAGGPTASGRVATPGRVQPMTAAAPGWPEAAARAITADDRAGLGLAVALEESDPKRLEEDSHLGVERCAARHPGLDPPADLGADLLAQREREYAVHRPVPRLQSLLIFVG